MNKSLVVGRFIAFAVTCTLLLDQTTASPAHASWSVGTRSTSTSVQHCTVTYPSPLNGITDLISLAANAMGNPWSKPVLKIDNTEYESRFGWFGRTCTGGQAAPTVKKKRFRMWLVPNNSPAPKTSTARPSPTIIPPTPTTAPQRAAWN